MCEDSANKKGDVLAPQPEQQARGNIDVLLEASGWHVCGASAANFRTPAVVQSNPTNDVPMRLRNAPTKLMNELSYGRPYRYVHDEPEAYAAGERYFPDDMEEQTWYQFTPRGLESKMAEKRAHRRKLHEETGKG